MNRKPPNAGKGRKKGSRNKATLLRERIEASIADTINAKLTELQRFVCGETLPMAEAQASHAKGVGYMVLRHQDGTYSRATDEKQVDAAIAAGAEMFKIFTQAPNTPAFTALLDRTFGKPQEPPQNLNITGSVDVAGLLKARHARRRDKPQS